jgi:hypothetical protein
VLETDWLARTPKVARFDPRVTAEAFRQRENIGQRRNAVSFFTAPTFSSRVFVSNSRK